MSTSLPRRLRSLFGADIEDLNEAHLKDLIGQPETDDLEVKTDVYGRGDSAKRELCADVAALANARGGLLLIGASESDDVVDALTPVTTDGQEIWIRQVLASGIVPPLPVLSCTIPASSTDGTGYIAVAVAASVDAPHAVVLNDDFRYVVRDGPRKRPMREPEVADQHRKRVPAAVGGPGLGGDDDVGVELWVVGSARRLAEHANREPTGFGMQPCPVRPDAGGRAVLLDHLDRRVDGVEE